jgi:hypothetical protein
MIPPIECFYLDLDKPLLVYQRLGGLVVVPFTIAGARHVVCVRIDPLDDDETVEVIPAYPRDPDAALEALVEGLDAVRDATVQARTCGHDEAVRLCERAVGSIETAAQDAAEARYTPQPEQRQQAKALPSSRRVHSLPLPPLRSRRGARTAARSGAR